MSRAPHTLVLNNATEAGHMERGRVTESEPFGLFKAHFRVSSRCCNPYSSNEKGSAENAVGFLRRTLFSAPAGDLARRLEAPAQPRSAMILATRFSEVTAPSRLGRANILGEP